MLGIGLLTSYITPIPSGVAILLLSLPIYIFTWFYKKSLFWFNMLGVIFISFLLEVIPDFEPPFHIPPLLSAWLGGVMIGTGIGVLLRSHITTDGLDLLAHLLSFKTNMNVGILIFFPGYAGHIRRHVCFEQNSNRAVPHYHLGNWHNDNTRNLEQTALTGSPPSSAKGGGNAAPVYNKIAVFTPLKQAFMYPDRRL